ncbi:hypothetical protein G647_02578 [Cladophialophora carrionii CBS 160.54]|uniref:SPT2 chromatin protein n=1 Tax=Cladophialophora carrionii CBS 160.54 TaxID=1279043 RepID=V9DHJ2_9EURO|nr:uncharacterized protein G647_02578 [Cladophialophora carrionii CBS 160.54]ETI25803.1 hypothetical protein G647_02578 [Cladophialophora carrionii CBS 160.54]
MSLFSDIVNSIGGDKSPAPPKLPARPLSVNGVRPVSDVSKIGSRLGVPAVPSPLNGVKRKAEDGSPKLPEKLIKPNPISTTTNRVTHRPAAPPLNAPKPANEKSEKSSFAPRPKLEATADIPARVGTASITPPTTVPKGPAKGSYAELMARAKQAQTEKAQQSQVGMIKHQPTHRERVSKVAERRRQEEEKAKASKEKIGSSRPIPGGKQQVKSRSVSPTKRTDQPRVPKAPRPPLHAPPSSSYKGTMGITSGRTAKPPPKRRRYDEYLGTDEEDVSDDMGGYGEDEEDDYGSDGSSDMEAGLDDLDAEEQRALKAAKEEDARELALENQLKREKEEKRKRLMALADKRRK